jgi:1-acyl-sn-glycerol-3-phosphate acyltransferase
LKLVSWAKHVLAVPVLRKAAVLAPEGTRRRVDKWKTGFWKIARAADVPVLCVAFDYPNRCVRIGPLMRCTDDFDVDMVGIRAWYRPFMGKNRGTV